MSGHEYADTVYPSAGAALAAAWWDLLTAGGEHDTETAYGYALDGIHRNLSMAAQSDWVWPGEPTDDDHRAAFGAVVRLLAAGEPYGMKR